MKRLICLLLSVIICLSLFGCSKKDSKKSVSSKKTDIGMGEWEEDPNAVYSTDENGQKTQAGINPPEDDGFTYDEETTSEDAVIIKLGAYFGTEDEATGEKNIFTIDGHKYLNDKELFYLGKWETESGRLKKEFAVNPKFTKMYEKTDGVYNTSKNLITE